MNYKKTEEAKFDFLLNDYFQKTEDLNYFLKEFLGKDIADFDYTKFDYQIGISIKTDVSKAVTILSVKLKSIEQDVSDVNQLSLFNQNSDDGIMIIKDRKQKLPANTKIEISSSIDNMSGVITDDLNQLVEFENKILSKKQTHRRQKNG